jgi:hypothetical protein
MLENMILASAFDLLNISNFLIGFFKADVWHENPRFHRVVFNDGATARPCLLPPLAVKSKPPAVRVVVDSEVKSRQLGGLMSIITYF